MKDMVVALEKAQGVKYEVTQTKTADEVADGKAALAQGDFKAGSRGKCHQRLWQ